MTTVLGELDDGLAQLAERIEAALERAGRRGMSPAAVARRARCSTADARLALTWLTGHQYAHTGTRNHPGQYFAGRPR